MPSTPTPQGPPRVTGTERARDRGGGRVGEEHAQPDDRRRGRCSPSARPASGAVPRRPTTAESTRTNRGSATSAPSAGRRAGGSAGPVRAPGAGIGVGPRGERSCQRRLRRGRRVAGVCLRSCPVSFVHSGLWSIAAAIPRGSHDTIHSVVHTVHKRRRAIHSHLGGGPPRQGDGPLSTACRRRRLASRREPSSGSSDAGSTLVISRRAGC